MVGRQPISVLGVRDRLGVRPGRLFVAGEWIDGAREERWTHVHPASGEEVTTLAMATRDEVGRAVSAARKAFDEGPWPHLKARERRRMLTPLVDRIRAASRELTELQSLDNGLPMSFGQTYRLSGEYCADAFDHYFGWIDKLGGETFPQYSDEVPLQFLSFREPVGVVVAIHPWNGPLLQFPHKVGAALAAGCCLVVKPSEYASLAILRIGELISELDLPPGVFNLVTGTGPGTGEALISDDRVDKISFTGSKPVGQRIVRKSADSFRRVTLELGGKSPALVFPGERSVTTAAETLAGQLFFGLSGQVCTAQSRAIVHESVFDEFVGRMADHARRVRMGSPFDPETNTAPMINRPQLDKVRRFVDRGLGEGAEMVFGQDDEVPAEGNWVGPKLFVNVGRNMAIGREEVFGPVLVATPFKDEDDAVRQANDTDFGLAAGVYTEDVAQAFRVSRRIRAGAVGVNAYSFMPNSPFGGVKESGIGREGGRTAIENYTEVKTVAFYVGEDR